MSSLYAILTDSRRHAAVASAFPDVELRASNLPSSWVRTASASRIVYRREIRGGRQTVATVGWDSTHATHTWELQTHWHDARGVEAHDCASFGAALAEADVLARS